MMQGIHSAWKKYGPWLLLALLVVSLIPILLLGRYDWPSADDYSYALLSHESLLKGECPLVGSWKYIVNCYKGWQGTFSAIGMMTLTPPHLLPLPLLAHPGGHAGLPVHRHF